MVLLMKLLIICINRYYGIAGVYGELKGNSNTRLEFFGLDNETHNKWLYLFL